MVGFANFKDLVEAEAVKGQMRYFTWRKSPSQVTTARVWFDLSMSPGNPVPQYYASSPMVAVVMKQSDQGGIFHGSAVFPAKKYLRKIMALATAVTALPMQMVLCDYLLYYPFIDEGNTDEQTFDNTATITRYTDGKGVQMMAVSVAPRTGGQSFYVKYTNQDGVEGRISQTCRMNTAAANGGIITTQGAAVSTNLSPFIPLQEGDTGVRKIESVTMLGPDVGLFTLVLVKPLANLTLRGIDAPCERDFFLESNNLPEIQDDAYLSFVCLPRGTLAATAIHGDITVVWN